MSTLTQPTGATDTSAVTAGLRRLMNMPAWLVAISQPERVRAALVDAVPEFASGILMLEGCAVSRIRLKRGQEGWNALYELTIMDRGTDLREVVPLVGKLYPPGFEAPAVAGQGTPFGAEGWRCYLPDLRLELKAQSRDDALPALALLTDADAARQLLERSIQSANQAYRDLRIQTCSIKAMRYKAGSRCTVVYQLEYAPEFGSSHGWPTIVVAKTYHGDKGQNAYDGMRELWESPLRTSGLVTLAEPLAYLPDLRVLIQGPIAEEQTLEDLLKSALRSGDPGQREQLRGFMGKTAVALAALHGSGVRHGEVLTWADELQATRALIERLAIPLPELADVLSPLLQRLEQRAGEVPPDPIGPAHHAFRPAQVLLHGAAIGFIDFDGFCQSEPALDVALFLRKTTALGTTTSRPQAAGGGTSQSREATLSQLAEAEAICADFLNAYMAHASISTERIALWQALDLITLVLFCWTKVEPARLETNMLLLERHLATHNLW